MQEWRIIKQAVITDQTTDPPDQRQSKNNDSFCLWPLFSPRQPEVRARDHQQMVQ